MQRSHLSRIRAGWKPAARCSSSGFGPYVAIKSATGSLKSGSVDGILMLCRSCTHTAGREVCPPLLGLLDGITSRWPHQKENAPWRLPTDEDAVLR